MDATFHPSFGGALFAALAAATGAPLFGEGLRSLRLRRFLSRLPASPLAESPTGFLMTRGRVALDGPLFSPLTGRPVAGFRLEVLDGNRAADVIERRRSFRIVDGAVSARVMAGRADWRLSETARRELKSGEEWTDHLAGLFAGSAEVRWLRRRGRPVVLVEHALFAGDECHVIGQARIARPHEAAVEVELARTGTDDAAVLAVPQGSDPSDSIPASGAGGDSARSARPRGPFGIERRRPGRVFPGDADLWIERAGHLDFLMVSDRAPAPAALAQPLWRTAGLLLGPALSFAGLVYLAHLADLLRQQLGY